jgi:hypothetical protein
MRSDVHSRLVRIRAKVPMHRPFVKVFHWFWFTVWDILAIVFLSTRLTGMRQVTAPKYVCDGCADPGGRGCQCI